MASYSQECNHNKQIAFKMDSIEKAGSFFLEILFVIVVIVVSTLTDGDTM